MRSSSRPGQAIKMSTPRRSALDLGGVAKTTIDDSDADRAGERAKHGVDLFGKFTCWCQYERAWPPGLSTADAGDERDPKGERLA